MDNNFSYGLLGYNSINIGDEIQSVAQSRFLPQIDEVVYREQIKNFVPKLGKKTKCIMNAWWMWRPKNFPPSKWIEPLLISMHIRPAVRKEIFTNESKEYFLKHGPVGCRDMGTYEWLKNEGIPAYFSGCLTLTLQRNYNIPRQDYILCVDVDENIVAEIISEQEYNPFEMALNLAKKKKIGPYRIAENKKDYQTKDMGILIRAGFDYDIVKQVLNYQIIVDDKGDDL